MRALVSLFTQCSRLTRHTASLAAQLHYHTSQLSLFSTSVLPPFQLLPVDPSLPHPHPIYAIIGLGNPGPMFTNTRHNVGAMCVQHMADTYSVSLDSHQPIHLCRLAQCVRRLPLTLTRDQPPDASPPLSSPRHLLLVVPTTYMNDSGRAVLAVMSAYRIPPHHCILLHDDVHLPLGTLRITTRHTSSPAGHNGVADTLRRLTAAHRRPALVRVRVGVGGEVLEAGGEGLAQYVLGRFTREERAVLEAKVYAQVRRAVEGIAAGEEKRMMNNYNGKHNSHAKEQTHRNNTGKADQPRQQTHSDSAAVT